MELTHMLRSPALHLPVTPIRSNITLLRRSRLLITFGVVCLAGFLLLGNALILGSHLWATKTSERATLAAPTGIHNFHAVDSVLWRGGRPTEQSYRELAARGVATIVDLRAEEHVSVPEKLIADLGMNLVRIPLRDGQAPNGEQVATFLEAVRSSPGIVYVHCMAGVGRTGTMVAAYLVEMRGVGTTEALRHNLTVGPPSLEQIAFVAGDIERANPVVTALSRVLDGPRRLYSYVN